MIEGGMLMANIGRITPRECGIVSRSSLRGALATKQSILSLCCSMDCFASTVAHSRDPLARNDGVGCLKFESNAHRPT
jgi:hypothetical protein